MPAFGHVDPTSARCQRTSSVLLAVVGPAQVGLRNARDTVQAAASTLGYAPLASSSVTGVGTASLRIGSEEGLQAVGPAGSPLGALTTRAIGSARRPTGSRMAGSHRFASPVRPEMASLAGSAIAHRTYGNACKAPHQRVSPFVPTRTS